MKVYSAVKLPDVARERLSKAGIEYRMHDELSTPSEKEIINNMVSGSDSVEVLIVGVNVPVTRDIIESNENLKLIANVGAGYNHIDIKAANEHNIAVTNSPAKESTESTAELAILLMLALSRRIAHNYNVVTDGAFEGWQVMGYLGGNQMIGKSLLIIGFGTIGQHIAKIASSFDMTICYVDHKIQSDKYKRVDLEEGLAEADFVVLQMNYTKENHHMINADTFKMMKSTAYLINNARGGIVDEDALVKALELGEIRGAALDVHEFEPEFNQKLMKMDNVILTPHIGNDTVEAREKMSVTAVEAVIEHSRGEALTHQVNK